MKNEFAQVMKEQSDKELIKIVTLARKNYKEKALEAAQAEIDSRNIDPNYFEDYKMKLFAEKDKIDGIAKLKASKMKRGLNFIIDTSLLVSLIFLYYFYILEASTLPLFFSLLLYFGYYIILENTYGQTLGKLITNTKIIAINGDQPNLEQVVSRAICRFIPFDPVSFLFQREGMKFHDSFTKTTVIEK